MTFDAEGRAVWSPALSEGTRKLWGGEGVRLSRMTGNHENFLKHHRQQMFRTAVARG